MLVWWRQIRVDNGRSFLPQVWVAGASVLSRTLDPTRIRAQASVHVHPNLQAILRLQTLGLRVNGLSAHENAY